MGKERLMKEKEEEKERQKKEREHKENQRKEKELEKERLEKIERDKQAKVAKVFENFFIKSPPQSKKDYKMIHATNSELNINNINLCDEVRNHQQEPPNKHLSVFSIKKNMRLAPICRKQLDPGSKRSLDYILSNSKWEDRSKLYLSNLNINYNPSKEGKTWPICKKYKSPETNECIDEYDSPMTEDDQEEEKTAMALLELDGDSIVDIPEFFKRNKESNTVIEDRKTSIDKYDSNICKTKAKLLQFHSNQRPPYWGTWSKNSIKIGPRRPFAKDSNHFDYEFDSDDDWEEEEGGESLSDEEKDNEEEPEEDEDDDDGFFVGHGVLDKDEAHLIESDDESLSKNIETSMKSRDRLEEDLEIKKMKLRAEMFEEEYKRQKSMPPKLKPRVFGCFWKNNFDIMPLNALMSREKIIHDKLMKILQPYASVLLDNERLAI